MKKFKILLASALLASTSATCFGLTAQTPYTITSSKLNSNGTLTTIETVPAQADANGKLTFSLTTLPTNADVNFIALTIKDQSGAVVRQGIAPAPPSGDMNQLGINDLATVQAQTFIKAAELAGSDDPILAAYLLVLLRSPAIEAGDVVKLAGLANSAILGAPGFESYMLANGVTSAKLATLKSCLVYNPDGAKKSLRDFTKGFFTAVESGSSATETTETQKAGGLMADVFMDAAACAGVELEQVINAHEAAGEGAEATGLMFGAGAISANVMSSIDQSMSAFNRKVGMVKMATEYKNALSTLQATGSQVDTFIAAAQAMAVSSAAVEAQYGDYFKDPAAYLAAHPAESAETVQQAINTIYQDAWSAFQTAIAASTGEIDALKLSIAEAFPGIELPADFGINYDFEQNATNWPIPQVVMVDWMVDLIKAGGSISYTRDTTPIPAMMQQWMGSCSAPQYYGQPSCEGNGGTWTSARSTFTTPSSAFNAYLGIQQDVSIAEMTKNAIWNTGSEPTQQMRQQAAAEFFSTLSSIEGKIVATKAGGAPASDAEKKAIVKLMLQPQN